MPQHRTEVLDLGSDFVASCSCGWVDPKETKTPLAAKQNANRHKITSMRAEKGPATADALQTSLAPDKGK